jgi:Family of unknown function (DUF6510)
MTSESMSSGPKSSEPGLDGNVLAGDLREIFAFEATATVSTCAACGTRAPVATWTVFVRAPGMIARCPTCGRVQVRIVHAPDERTWVDLSGLARLELGGHGVA